MCWNCRCNRESNRGCNGSAANWNEWCGNWSGSNAAGCGWGCGANNANNWGCGNNNCADFAFGGCGCRCNRNNNLRRAFRNGYVIGFNDGYRNGFVDGQRSCSNIRPREFQNGCGAAEAVEMDCGCDCN